MDNIQSTRLARLRRRSIIHNRNRRQSRIRHSQSIPQDRPSNLIPHENIQAVGPYLPNIFGVRTKTTQNIASRSVVNSDESVITRTIIEPTVCNENHMANDDSYCFETITERFERPNLIALPG